MEKHKEYEKRTSGNAVCDQCGQRAGAVALQRCKKTCKNCHDQHRYDSKHSLNGLDLDWTGGPRHRARAAPRRSTCTSKAQRRAASQVTTPPNPPLSGATSDEVRSNSTVSWATSSSSSISSTSNTSVPTTPDDRHVRANNFYFATPSEIKGKGKGKGKAVATKQEDDGDTMDDEEATEAIYRNRESVLDNATESDDRGSEVYFATPPKAKGKEVGSSRKDDDNMTDIATTSHPNRKAVVTIQEDDEYMINVERSTKPDHQKTVSVLGKMEKSDGHFIQEVWDNNLDVLTVRQEEGSLEALDMFEGAMVLEAMKHGVPFPTTWDKWVEFTRAHIEKVEALGLGLGRYRA